MNHMHQVIRTDYARHVLDEPPPPCAQNAPYIPFDTHAPCEPHESHEQQTPCEPSETNEPHLMHHMHYMNHMNQMHQMHYPNHMH